jgi:hypothetical protein
MIKGFLFTMILVLFTTNIFANEQVEVKENSSQECIEYWYLDNVN